MRGPSGEELSFISRINFYLHESFAQSCRCVTEPPFEVSENGWGEFDVRIKIFFKDETQEPIEITHGLKLYPPGNLPSTVKRPVLHEIYDEIVFTNPSPEFVFLNPPKRSGENPLGDYLTLFSEVEDLQLLQAAHEVVLAELNKAKWDLSKIEFEKKNAQERLALKFSNRA